MRHVGVIAVLLAMLPVWAVAAKDAKFTEEQLARVGSATKEYLMTNAQFVLHATAGGVLMSVDDQIGQSRPVEGYCKQYAACLVS
jgi:hypothetical protein